VTCFARACRQEHPCPTDRACERVWHACTPPDPLHVQWTCWCKAVWTWRLTDHGGIWHRDPLVRNLTGVS
jgi:hypothetical protein